MLSLSQQIRAGLALNELYERHPLVRCYLSLVLMIAPRKYRRLFELRDIIGEWLS
jgi:hypothetical protein